MPGAGLRQRLAALLRRPVAADTGALLLTIVAVQGLVPLAQLGAAKTLPPERFGDLRTAESLVALAVLIGALGMPTLVVTGVARLDSVGEQAALLRRVGRIAVAAASVAATALVVLAPLLLASPAVVELVRGLAPVVVLAVAGRTLLGLAQGQRRFRLLAITNTIAAAASLGVLIAAVRLYGLAGWAPARVAAEVALLVACLAVAWDVVRAAPAPIRASEHGTVRLVTLGAGIAGSLIARSAVDTVTLVALGHARLGPEAVGFFGLGSLSLAGLTLLPAALNAALLPRFARAREAGAAMPLLLRRAVTWSLLLTIPPAALIAMVAPLLLRWLGPDYLAGVVPLRILLILAPLRATSVAAGGVLLVDQRAAPGLVLSVTGLMVLPFLLPWSTSLGGLPGACLVLVSIEAVTALLLVAVARGVAERRSRAIRSPTLR